MAALEAGKARSLRSFLDNAKNSAAYYAVQNTPSVEVGRKRRASEEEIVEYDNTIAIRRRGRARAHERTKERDQAPTQISKDIMTKEFRDFKSEVQIAILREAGSLEKARVKSKTKIAIAKMMADLVDDDDEE